MPASPKTAAELLAEAIGLARSGAPANDVKAAWMRYECRCWYDAHVERGLNIADLPSEYRDGVFDIISSRQAAIASTDVRKPVAQ